MSSRYDHKAVEAKWQDRWEKQRDRRGRPPPRPREVLHARRCSPTRRATACTSATGATTSSATPSTATCACTASGRSTRWAGTPSACRPRTPPSSAASIRATGRFGNIKVMKEQFRRWGILYDWSKEIASCMPEYYRWNQWLFLRMLEKRAGLQEEGAGQLVPELPDRARQRAGGRRAPASAAARAVVQRDLEQWFFRITDYADRLLAGLDGLDGLAREGQGDAAQLDRPLRGRGDRLPGPGARARR